MQQLRRARSIVRNRSSRLLREARVVAARPRWHRDYEQIERYCQFVGFPRSGHTLIGALLNAHPDAVIGFEANALGHVRRSTDRVGLFDRIMRADRRFQSLGWNWTGYDYEVSGQWQGRYRRLTVIGDKRGGGTARQLAADAALLDRLRDVVAMPLRVVVVVRNPFDNVARISTRGKVPLPEASSRYLEVLRGTEMAIERLAAEELHVVRHEDFIADADDQLERLARFLGLEAPQDWVSACSALVFTSPRRARDDVEWTASERAAVDSQISASPLLSGYQFD